MKLTQKNVDNIIQGILNEEIDKKVSLVMEKLHGNQDRIDVAKPKGILNKKDFDKLHQMKKMETKEEEDGMCSECGGAMYEGECMECGYGGGTEMEEEDMGEGNAFSKAVRDAKNDGDKEFEFKGKTYPVKESKEKWIQKTKMKKGALHKKLGIPEDQTIPVSKLNKIKKELQSKAKGDKKLSAEDSKLLKQVNMALNLKSLKESNIKLTESELIDLIENVVLEEKTNKDIEVKVSDVTKKVKDNINKKYASGLSKTEKLHLKPSKKENDDYISSVTKKMKEYLKDMGDNSFEMNPKGFPKGNETKRVGYQATDAAKEFIENFGGGQENITYDEVHPNEDWVSANVEGSSKTGNNPKWANAVDTGVNKKRNQIRKDNLLGAVKQMAYNKAPQPVVDDMKKGSSDKFSKNFGKDAGKKASKILTQLESTQKRAVLNEEKKVIDELEKIRNLYIYNKKTQ